MVPPFRRWHRFTCTGRAHAGQAFFRHHPADAAQHDDVQDVDDGIDLAKRFQYFKDRSARSCAENAAENQNGAHLEIDAAAFHMCKNARHACARYLRGCRRCGNGWRDAVENKQWRGQEPAAHAKHSRQHTNAATQQDDDQRIDRQIGYRKIDIHV